METIDLTPIIEAIITLLAAIITYRVIPYIKSKTTKNQQEIMLTAVNIGVHAAEQIFQHGDNKNKITHATNFAVGYLMEHGYNVDVKTITTAAESAVYRLNPEPIPFTLPEIGHIDIPPVEEWSLEQLKKFCELNEIPCEGCETREEFLAAIDSGTTTESI